MPLANYAMHEEASRGRRHAEPTHAYRSAYARDRDRVIHSRSFRRLEAKTQVFTTRYSDHFRNRLTHTLEVAQIARTVAGALGLNAELVEALALVHDIGHPPFGHAGENRLDELMREHGGRFDHNLHALRTVERFEQRYLDFPGLNLTFEVREGIIKHSRDYPEAEFPELAEYLLEKRPPLEAQLIDLVDEIAYNTADLDDGFEARLLDLPEILDGVPLFAEMYVPVERSHPDARTKLKFNEANKRALDRLVTDLIEHTRTQLAASGARSVEDVRNYSRRLASFSPVGTRHNLAWKKFLSAKLYGSPALTEEREACVEALSELFRYYLEQPEKMPKFYAEQARDSAAAPQVVCDYIAGMTDHFLLRQHRELLGGMSGAAS
ncbi:MAG TPA: deoxyguanosinetriphosphate triphosphohydrolase [Candidatus Acidoferrales bacterium]|nr:deoxyguanosinetriphosphate triphosphohydrolase [Candidatus Acidoferrales bacterium]